MSDSIDLKYDKIIARTGKAILFLFGGEEVWLPKSQLDDYEDLSDNGGEVSVQYWIVEQEGLEGYEV